MLLDLIFPRRCVVCNFLGSYLCPACALKLKYIDKDFCFYCDRISEHGLTDSACGRRREIDGFLTIFHYNHIIKQVIKAVKYNFAHAVFTEFFSLIDPVALVRFVRLAKLYPELVLQPVPLHWQRQNWRGFNQAKLVAEFLSQLTGWQVVDSVGRARSTPQQVKTHNRVERYYNIKNAFQVKGELPERIALVDDVVTTGNTVKEIVTLVKQYGVKQVFVFALARG